MAPQQPTRRRGHRVRVGRIAAIGWVALVMAMDVAADTVRLRDGTLLDGTLKQVPGGYEFTPTDAGPRRFLATDNVASISVNSRDPVSAPVAQERLASLERSVEVERDIDRVITRYEQFVGQYPNTDAANSATAALTRLREMKAAGQTIRYGREWVTAADRDARLLAAAERVTQIALLIRDGQTEQAAAAIEQELKARPDDASLNYLAGVLAQAAGRNAEAKRAFDRVEASVPDHAPTLLNQAALAASTKRWPQATLYLEQALTHAPGAPEVLDAVHEFTALVPDATRRSQPWDRLMKRREPQEAAYAKRQAAQGRYRYGSTWVDQATLDKAKAERDEWTKQMRVKQEAFDASTQRARQLDQQAASIQQTMRLMEANTSFIGADGKRYARPLPLTYYEMQRDLDGLAIARREETRVQADLRDQADAVQKQEPKPPFVGRITPIGEVGVPVLLPSAVATTPTTSPSTAPATEPTAGVSAFDAALNAAPAPIAETDRSPFDPPSLLPSSPTPQPSTTTRPAVR